LLLKPFWLKRGMTSDYSPTHAPASQEEGVDDDALVAVGPELVVDGEQLERGPRRRRGLGVLPSSGEFHGWIVADSALPEPASAADGHELAQGDLSAFAVAKFEWRLSRASPEAASRSDTLRPARHGRPTRAQDAWGYVEYKVLTVWPLAVQMPLTRDMDLRSESGPRRLRTLCNDVRVTVGFDSVSDLCCRGPGSKCDSVVFLPFSVAIAACVDTPTLVRSVPLLLRQPPLDLVLARPHMSVISRWKRVLDVRRLAQLPAM